MGSEKGIPFILPQCRSSPATHAADMLAVGTVLQNRHWGESYMSFSFSCCIVLFVSKATDMITATKAANNGGIY